MTCREEKRAILLRATRAALFTSDRDGSLRVFSRDAVVQVEPPLSHAVKGDELTIVYYTIPLGPAYARRGG